MLPPDRLIKRRRSTAQIEELLARYSADGKALEYVSKLLGRSTTTLRRYARQLSLSFSDYTPKRKNND